MQPEHKLSFIDRLRIMRETRFGAFVPVLLALAAIWACPPVGACLGSASFRSIAPGFTGPLHAETNTTSWGGAGISSDGLPEVVSQGCSTSPFCLCYSSLQYTSALVYS